MVNLCSVNTAMTVGSIAIAVIAVTLVLFAVMIVLGALKSGEEVK